MGQHEEARELVLGCKVTVDYQTEMVNFITYTINGDTREILNTVGLEPEMAAMLGDDLQRSAMELAQHMAARGPDVK